MVDKRRFDVGYAVFWRRNMLGVVGRLVIGTWFVVVGISIPRVPSQQTSGRDFYMLIIEGHGDAAIQQLADIAASRGGWGPAPGDMVVFDPDLSDTMRGATVIIDSPPRDCEFPDRPDRRILDCDGDYVHQQSLVRFGVYTFVDQDGDGLYIAHTLDDMLSSYIEEVGHSWQEYCHETKRHCAGERMRNTTWEDGEVWIAGWEYQIKRYILNLDGTLLALSVMERETLLSQICDGYARPVFSPVETAPPPGWPQPECWPTTVPSRDELETLCTRPVQSAKPE